MKKKKFSYIELIQISPSEIVERIDTSSMTDKNHLKALNSIGFNEEVFKIDEFITNTKYDEIGKDETSVILKHLMKHKEQYKYNQ